MSLGRGKHLFGVAYYFSYGHARRRRNAGRTGDQAYVSAGIARRGCQGKAHAAGAAVGNYAHCVNGLDGRAGRHHNGAPAQGGIGVGQANWQLGEDVVKISQPAGAVLAAGKVSFFRPDKMVTEFAQNFDVAAGGRVGPHLLVHGRRDQQRTVGRACQGGDQVVGKAAREPGDGGGRGRRDQHNVGASHRGDMIHAVGIVVAGKHVDDRRHTA